MANQPPHSDNGSSSHNGSTLTESATGTTGSVRDTQPVTTRDTIAQIPFWTVYQNSHGVQYRRIRVGVEMSTMLQVYEGYWQTVGFDDSAWTDGPFTPAPSPHQQIVEAVAEMLDVTAGFKRCLYSRIAPNYNLVNQLAKFAAHYAGIQGNQIYTTAEQLDQIPLAHMSEDQARSAAWSLRQAARIARDSIGE